MKKAITLLAMIFSLNLNAHDDLLKSDEHVDKIIASCESKRESSSAQLLGADAYVADCVTSDLSRLGKLKKYQKKYPDEYEKCHKTQPYGLSATVICIESLIN